MKLIPLRTTFINDITEEERQIMNEHVVYWSEFINEGTAIIIGPVADPKGVYGIAVVEVDSEEQLNEIIEHDPSNGMNRFEVYSMARAMYKK
ncbi:MAG: YciI family protein [Ginsengibacter sp.]